MPRRSFSDVPNRVVRLFLQDAGRQYDINRGHKPFVRLTAELTARFGDNCSYCGTSDPLVEEHLVPINRTDVGLHAWGNIVPSCKTCNYIKSGKDWRSHPKLDDSRIRAIEKYISDYQYSPDVEELRVVLQKLYELADRQTRALVDFGLVASRPYIAGLHTSPAVLHENLEHTAPDVVKSPRLIVEVSDDQTVESRTS